MYSQISFQIQKQVAPELHDLCLQQSCFLHHLISAQTHSFPFGDLYLGVFERFMDSSGLKEQACDF